MRFFRYVGSLSGSALGRRTVEVVGRNWISSHSHINVVPGSAGVKRIGRDEIVRAIGARLGASPCEVVLAWLCSLSPVIVPLPGATRMQEALGKRSRLVLVDGGGHAIIGIGDNICAAQTFSNYMASGILPAEGTTCPANPSGASAAAVSPERREVIRKARREMMRSRY